MSPFDRADYAERLRILKQAVADLSRYLTTVPLERLVAERDIQYMLLHALYTATQSMIDLALQSRAARGLTTDGMYKDAFRVLTDNGHVDRALSARLQGGAGFRNVVAHLDSGLDLHRVHSALDEFGDLSRFAEWAGSNLPA